MLKTRNNSVTTRDHNNAQALGYNLTHERVYKSNHPDVIRWTSFFHQRIASQKIFETFRRNTSNSSERAQAVANQWFQFSKFMPWFLCKSAAKVSNNQKRHYIIQTAFEELGMRDATEIHADMFNNAARQCGITISAEDAYEESEFGAPLRFLRSCLEEASEDSHILGLLLGIEVPAVENIETVFLSIGFSNELALQLATEKFFILHRQIEPEHVRLTVANFLRFCRTKRQRSVFIRGFDQGVTFWSKFWVTAAGRVNNTSLESAHARLSA